MRGPQRVRWLAAALPLVLIAACTQPAAIPTRPPTPTSNPLAVTVKLDSSHAKSAFVPASGGSVSASASDGSTFVLEVPPGALLSEERITLTPAASVDGLPFSGGMLASVDLAPAGLRLLKAATLTIKPSRTATKGVIAYAYAADGKELIPYPSDNSGGAVQLAIYHFSGNGVADGNPSEVTDAAAKYPPTQGEAAAQSAAAAASAACKARQCDPNTDPTYRSAIEKLVKDWFDGTVAPDLSAAETDDGVLATALAGWIAWELTAIRLGVNDKFSSQDGRARASAIKGLQNALEAATKRCAKNFDVGEVRNMLLWGGIAIKLGFGGEPGLDAKSVVERVKKCANFELSFDSVTTAGSAQGGLTSHWSGTVPLVADSDLTALTGEGTVNGEVKISPSSANGCTFTVSSSPASLKVPLATLGLNIGSKTREWVVVVNPEGPRITTTFTCPRATTSTSGGDPWIAVWRINHMAEGQQPLGYFIRDWDVSGTPGPTLATKTYRTADETTTLTILHKPGS